MESFDPVAYINEPRWQESRYGLERMQELLGRMGRPQDKLRFVHVAGTNGKGSTCAYIEAALREAGYRTGLFTSPYIIAFEERIRVDGQNINPADLRDVTLFVAEHAEAMAEETGDHPTEFELMTAVAFEHFARSGCDIVVAEVGLGGRLDSTNVIESPEVCVITRIGLDHTGLLGDTPAKIAAEKAGIIKANAAVVSWPQEEEDALDVICTTAAAVGATSVVFPNFAELTLGPIEGGVREFRYKDVSYKTALLGSYQPSNAALALETLWALRSRGLALTDEAISRGIERTVWPARFEVVQAGPPAIIVDGGHNPQGAAVLAESLRDAFPGRRVVFVMSVLADKDYRAMVAEVLPLAKAFVCATPPNPRALAAADLAKAIEEAARLSEGEAPVDVVAAKGFSEALDSARALAGSENPVCAFGSLYSVGLIKQALAG